MTSWSSVETAGSLAPISAPSVSDHDFDAVAFRQMHFGETAARDDFTVALDGQALAFQRQLIQQLREGERLRKFTGSAVQCHANHAQFYSDPPQHHICLKRCA